MQVHILLVLTALCFPTTKASRHPVFVALNDGRDKKANSDVTILGLGAAAQWLNDPGDRVWLLKIASRPGLRPHSGMDSKRHTDLLHLRNVCSHTRSVWYTADAVGPVKN